MNSKFLISASAVLLGAATLLPMAASAAILDVNTHASVDASTSVGSLNVNAHASTTVETRAKARADQEITRRISSLTALSTRIGEMKKLTSSEVTALQASITTQISALNTLKAKIDADTDLATLKTDIQSIAKDYRIYMVVLPQGRVTAVADRIETIVADMTALEPKLQARITAAQAAGKNVSAAVSANADFQAKIADANTQAQAAVNEVVNLKPDQGDAATKAANAAAFKDAQAKIKVAMEDLKAARKDIDTIRNAVKGVDASGTASTSAKESS